MTAAKLTMPLLAVGLFLLIATFGSAQSVTEIIVTEKLPGPPLWQVRHRGNTLWIFADVSPLPKNFDWDSSYVERIIAGADAFLPKPAFDWDIGVVGIFKIRRGGQLQQLRRKLPSGTALDQVIDSASMRKFRKVMDDWDIRHSSIMQYKPMPAASILYGNVLEKAGMENSQSVLNRLEALRRKHRVPRTRTEISFNSDDFIDYLEEAQSVPEDFGTQCLEYLLENMLGLEELRQRNILWYQREISFMEFTGRENMCARNAIEDTQWNATRHTALRQYWYDNLDKAIRSNKRTFAVVDMNLFAIPSREFYQWIEENGYELEEPR